MPRKARVEFPGAVDHNRQEICRESKTDPFWIPVSDDLRALFNTAREYGSGNPAVRANFAALDGPNTKVIIERSSSMSPDVLKTTRMPDGTIITRWNPEAAVKFTNGNTQSPAMVLLHEIAGHAERFARDPRGAYNDTKKPDGLFGNREERRVIQGIESDAADTKKEGHRFNGGGKFYPVGGVLDRKEIKK